MDLYYNCSYDNSPVGFCIGKISSVNSLDLMSEKALDLSKENIDPFIRKCFESGLIRSAYGKIPSDYQLDSEGYFLVKKKMLQKRENCNYYMNIAIADLTRDEFLNFMKFGTDDTEVNLATLILESIQQNKNSDFGYEIRSEKLSGLIEFKYANVCECDETQLQNIQRTDCFYAKVLGANADEAIMNRVFGEPRSMIKTSGNYVCFQKKTKSE